MPPTRASQGLKPKVKAAFQHRNLMEGEVQHSRQVQFQQASPLRKGNNSHVNSSGKIKSKIEFSFDEKQDQSQADLNKRNS
jgi:hypothetical protein